ncbi:MAG: NADH-quinone oxidoreductase subunit N [Methanomassiliicoccaceae archaeon]|nr:NADH-quinone oxidoreductase subunit N [Methanomassiliicoccaceae archaeon]
MAFITLQDVTDVLMPILPIFILIVAALIAPAIGTKNGKAAGAFTMIAAILALIVTGYYLYDGYTDPFMNLFAFNDFTGLMAAMFLVVLFLVAMVSLSGSESRKHHGEYYSLLIAATIGMIMVSGAKDMIILFIGIELTSITSYALVAFKKNDPRSAESAVKYLIIGGISTALSLYGISLLYGLSGSTNIAVIADFLAQGSYSWTYIVGVITLIAGLGFKVAMVPFHSWAPDVYEGAPTPVTTFLAVGSKKMGFIAFFKIFLLMFILAQAFGGLPEMQWLFAIMAAVTMTFGNVIAISQTSIKRMLAYSSIAQAGYILIVLAVASEYALAGGIFHMIMHVFMKGGAFIVVAALAARGLGENISDYRGLSRRAPLVAVAMMLFMFSLAGIPPLGGFWSKFILFSSGIPDGTWIWLIALAVINSAISLYYYARVVKAMFVDKPLVTEKVKVPASFKVAIAICTIAVIFVGIYPMPIIELCEAAAAAFPL